MRRSLKFVVFGALGLVAAGALGLALRPAPIPVETARITVGALEVTAEEQGETRAHDRFVVAAPVTGRLMRVLLRDGDSVLENQTVATMAPLPLSGRERDELNARIAASEAIQRGAEAQLSHLLEDLAQAQRESARLERLQAQALVSQQEFEQARNAAITLEKDVAAARYRVKSAEADVRGARAGLAALADQKQLSALVIRAPSTGRVLRVLEASERVLAAGTPILVIGDLNHLEVVMEMLSSEAVRVAPDMPASLEDWGGAAPLRARVRLVEPYAFLKISALGVEERRTRVILDIIDPPVSLGDGYRVYGRISIWRGASVLKVPIAALFRCREDWCVFAVENGRARQRKVVIDHRNRSEAEVRSGLSAGDIVVTYPANELQDNSRVSLLQ